MILIATITGALAYNYKGSLAKGKAFKTEQTIKKIETILTIHLTESPEDAGRITDEAFLRKIIKNSPIAPSLKEDQDPLLDGWGKKMKIIVDNDSNDEISVKVTSEALERYKRGQ